MPKRGTLHIHVIGGKQIPVDDKECWVNIKAGDKKIRTKAVAAEGGMATWDEQKEFVLFGTEETVEVHDEAIWSHPPTI